ncbi:L,D-transpeptidase family protein [Paenibacillus typhae]|uniref:L,D-peptidoglycan transpeptidase YkuD, ErfK/YbiS/YcfS/YnhG family n=1 Tax=Paenibacillus typhae TaxID=1174501 RepID=A0A1G8YI65_9BACL|nr:L,D-transpeptidase family protein [Paenibacillus typhae]SDK02393.1 L,D-peptidoglycan transpeptidase YkuD, ErfK/YbiS/YcfS/YnhG family [Paenibacillus typhae]
MNHAICRRIMKSVMCLLLSPVLVLGSFTPEAASAGFAASWPYKAGKLGASQMVVVTASSSRSTTGVLTLRENRDGSWKTVLSGIPVTLGASGIGKTKEGDKRTPSGVFRLGEAFGSAAGPEGLKLPYSKVGSRDYWIDDPGAAEYNQRVTFTRDPGSRWASYERLLHPLYKYAVVVRYNDEPVVPGKGSAIFLHIWRGAGQPTAGCIAMSESNLLKLMKLLDPELSPAIAIGIAK